MGKGFFVAFPIYNLTALLHQNKHLLNIMEMVLKSVMSARLPLNTAASGTGQHLCAEIHSPTHKMGSFRESEAAVILFFETLYLFSILKTCLQNLPYILSKQGALIIPASPPTCPEFLPMTNPSKNSHS